MVKHKRRPPIGARPGTLLKQEEALPPRIHVIHYTTEAVVEADIKEVVDIGKHWDRNEPGGSVTWVDIQGLRDLQVLQQIAEMFKIHPLALEDIVNVPQRPKTETYEHHQYYVTRSLRSHTDVLLDDEQVSMFFGRSYVLTFQQTYGDDLDPVRERIRHGKGNMRRSGPDYLAYAIIDTLIDAYFPEIDKFVDALEGIEEEVLTGGDSATLTEINSIKHDLLVLRRTIRPQRDAVLMLMRGDSPFVTQSVQTYLRDCYDHCVQIVDALEGYREMTGALMATYLSAVSNRTNEVMKVLTVISSIFIPLTFIVGVYGMNFTHMPEMDEPWAYPTLMTGMFGIAVGMFYYFRRRKWI
ncbi:MAG: magnesium/cobalt transporter CorA [Planctomycetota bacterium]